MARRMPHVPPQIEGNELRFGVARVKRVQLVWLVVSGRVAQVKASRRAQLEHAHRREGIAQQFLLRRRPSRCFLARGKPPAI